MSTILTSAIIQNATNSVNTYINSVTGLNDQLQDVINTLTSANFTGDASNGYKEFYTNKVVPAITENLTQQGTSLTASIISMLESIQQQLLNTVDPQLGDNNRNPGGAPTAGTTTV